MAPRNSQAHTRKQRDDCSEVTCDEATCLFCSPRLFWRSFLPRGARADPGSKAFGAGSLCSGSCWQSRSARPRRQRRRPGRAISTACWNAESVRFYLPYSRSLYFIDKGRERRHLCRPDPRIRALGEQEIRGTARQAPADRGRHRGHARQAAGRSSRRARRCRGRQHQGPPRAAEGRRLRRPRRERRRRRDPGDRPGHAGHRLDRRPFGQDRAPARGLEPDAEHEGVERALQAGRQARSQARLPAERARGRGPARDAQCRAAAGGRGRRLEGQDVGPGAAQGQGPRGHRAAAEDEDRLGDPQEQPEARGRADRVLCVLRQADGRSREAAAPVHGPHQGAEGRDSHRGPQAPPGAGRHLQEVRPAVQLRSSHAGCAGLPGVDAQPGGKEPGRRHRRDAGHARDRRGAQGGRHPPGRARTSMPASSTWTS